MGTIKKDRVGEKFQTSNGEIEIIEYINATNITVKFLSDDLIRRNVHMNHIKSGNVSRHHIKSNINDTEIGNIYTTNNYGDIEIIEYINASNVTVKFLNDNSIVSNIQLNAIKKGYVTNPYSTKPTLSNFGYIGIGNYKTTDSNNNRKQSTEYQIWSAMIMRCYDKNSQIINPSYIGCTVCDEWRNFQNFCEWFTNNYVKNWCLDKDILFKNNRIYSPSTCCFVPSELNLCFTKSNSIRGEYPIGVCLNKQYSEPKFQSQIKINNFQKYLGLFDTVDEAFQAYKLAKESYIKQLANKWKDKLNDNVYQALLQYEINITD